MYIFLFIGYLVAYSKINVGQYQSALHVVWPVSHTITKRVHVDKDIIKQFDILETIVSQWVDLTKIPKH